LDNPATPAAGMPPRPSAEQPPAPAAAVRFGVAIGLCASTLAASRIDAEVERSTSHGRC